MSKAVQIKRRSQGLCIYCGNNPPNQGRSGCEPCLSRMRIKKRDQRAFFKEIKCCPECGEEVIGDETYCLECAAKKYGYNIKSREKNKAKIAIYHKEYVERMKEKGICRRCGKRKVYTGRTYCETCLAKKRIYQANKRNDIARYEYPAYGRCYRCGKTLDRKGKLCVSCRETSVNNLEKAMEVNRAMKERKEVI